jgi:putative spermidine/putrescine transport system substrate-binding protein
MVQHANRFRPLRRLHVTALATVAALTVAGCGAAEQAEEDAASGNEGGSDTLTVSVFGGSWGTAIEDNIIKPFEEETGVEVRAVESTSTLALGKMRQDAGIFDVALLDSGVSEVAREEGVVATLDEDSLTHLEELDDRAQLRDDDGLWAVTMGFWALGIAYNTEEVEQAPTSWEDFWDERYAGAVSVPTPATTGGLPFLIQAAEMNGGGADNVAPGFEKLEKLDVAAFFDSSGTASNLLQSGEAVVSAHYNPGAWPMADQGLPIEWVAPEEGALAADSRWHLGEGSSKQELATEFINFASSAEAQQGLAEDLYVAPANTSVELNEETRARMPYGADGSLKDLQFSDWETINKHRSEWTKQWNKRLAR